MIGSFPDCGSSLLSGDPLPPEIVQAPVPSTSQTAVCVRTLLTEDEDLALTWPLDPLCPAELSGMMAVLCVCTL